MCIRDSTQTALKLAANEISLTDEQFLQFVNYFDVGIIETAHSLNKSNNANSWYLTLNVKAKTSKLKPDPNFLEIEFLIDTGATICILNQTTWNAIKDLLHINEKNLDQTTNTQLRTANNDLLPTVGLLHFHLFPIKEHPSTINDTFAIADTKYNILGLPFVQKYISTIAVSYTHLTLPTILLV